MSSILDKLLKGQKVEWLPIEQVIKSLKTGLNPRKNFELNTPDAENFYVTVREIQNGKIVFIDKTDKVNDHGLKLINNRSNLEVGDILFSGTGTVGRTAVILEEPKNWNIKEGVYVIKPEQNKVTSKFLAYLLNSNHIIKIYEKKIVGSPVISLPMAELKKIIVPIPPLDVQAEIVQILDAFTALTAELTAELTMREKQYHYYRDNLLTFSDDEVEFLTLNEVAIDFGRGKSKHRPRNDERLYGGEIPFVQTGDIRNAGHILSSFTQTYSEFGLEQSKLWKKGTLCITIAANIAETSILGFDACFPDSIIGFVANQNKTSEKYVEYLLSSLKSKLESKSTGSAQENLNLAAFSNLRLPFPSLEKQEKIIKILENFETYTNSITEGLPKEIALRQKQYEYYREQLLDFPKFS